MTPSRLAALGLAGALFLITAACGSDDDVRGDTPAVTVTPTLTATAVTFTNAAGDVATLTVEVADTAEERARGLMGRESLPENAGMLFVWPQDTGSGFWMKDTLVPLSIAFIEAGGTVLHIEDMEPLDETLHYSPEPYRYAVEANQGWFAEHGVKAGDRVILPEGVAAERTG